MANNIYNVNLLGGISLVTLTDDGIGSDWITITGIFPTYTNFTLNYSNVDGVATAGFGRYDFPGNTAHLLRVIGVIENVRGCDSADFIGGNDVNNILYGDTALSGVGGNDTVGGAEGDDTIFGGYGEDSLSGADDNDLIYGGEGDDTIIGGNGLDRISGGKGADILYGGVGDTVDFAASSAGVRVNVTYGSYNTGYGGDAQLDLIYGFSNIIGSNFSDNLTDTVTGTIAFGYNDSKFYGGLGNDRLNLGGGADLGYGGDGNDIVDGGEGNDRLFGDAGNDRLLGGNHADAQYGGLGVDTIYGGTGNDRLYGDAGSDFLFGDVGADRLYGGADADRFVYREAIDSTLASEGRDTIYNFSRAEGDRIDVRTVDEAPAVLLTYRGNAVFSGTAGELRWQAAGSNLLVTIDLNGDKVADFSVVVAGLGSLVVGDFLL